MCSWTVDPTDWSIEGWSVDVCRVTVRVVCRVTACLREFWVHVWPFDSRPWNVLCCPLVVHLSLHLSLDLSRQKSVRRSGRG